MGFGPISRTMHLSEPEDFRQCSCGCGRTAPCFTFFVFTLKVNGNNAVSTDILRVLSHFYRFYTENRPKIALRLFNRANTASQN